MQIQVNTEDKTPYSRVKSLKRGGLALLVIVFVILCLMHWRGHDDPVPDAVRKSASFSIYYPAKSKLPSGYELEKNSFRTAPGGALIFQVMTKNGQQLAFSEQSTPDSSVIDKFLNNYIPLRTSLSTNVGQAEIGAAGSGANLKTVASITINHGPWMIIVGPPNLAESSLQNILQSLTH